MKLLRHKIHSPSASQACQRCYNPNSTLIMGSSWGLCVSMKDIYGQLPPLTHCWTMLTNSRQQEAGRYLLEKSANKTGIYFWQTTHRTHIPGHLRTVAARSSRVKQPSEHKHQRLAFFPLRRLVRQEGKETSREASVLSSDNLIWTKTTLKANETEARLALCKLFPSIQMVLY